MKTLFAVLGLMFAVTFSSTATAANDYEDEINNAEHLGQLIYEQDTAGWVATDRLLADMKKGVEIKNPAGWLSIKDGKTYKTVFIALENDTPRVAYEAVSKKKKIKSAGFLKEYRALSLQESRLWAARNLVLTEKFDVCREFLPMNTIVMPTGDDDDRIYVYLFSATKEAGVMVLGKHYRFTVSADAKTVEDTKSFSNTCFSIPYKNRPKGSTPVAAMATHIKAPYPEEHHVFASLSLNLDLYVSTSKTDMWKITNGTIKKSK